MQVDRQEAITFLEMVKKSLKREGLFLWMKREGDLDVVDYLIGVVTEALPPRKPRRGFVGVFGEIAEGKLPKAEILSHIQVKRQECIESQMLDRKSDPESAEDPWQREIDFYNHLEKIATDHYVDPI